VSTIDKLTIDTPEQMTLELPLAGVGSRLLAFIYDSLIQIIVFLVAGFIIAVIPGRTLRWFPNWIAPVLIVLFWFCLYWGYFAFFETIWRGQTPGKRQAGIRVIKDTGRPINGFEAIARNLLRAVDSLPGVYGVALVSMMISSQNRRLGDYVAGTVVVHDNKGVPVHAEWADSSDQVTSSLPAEAILSADELLLVETFMERRSELPDDVRQLNAWQIANQLSQQHKLEIPQGLSPEQFLEMLAKGSRDNARFRPQLQ
jgi:uncharacterized RDD family membrane protein YckC